MVVIRVPTLGKNSCKTPAVGRTTLILLNPFEVSAVIVLGLVLLKWRLFVGTSEFQPAIDQFDPIRPGHAFDVDLCQLLAHVGAEGERMSQSSPNGDSTESAILRLSDAASDVSILAVAVRRPKCR